MARKYGLLYSSVWNDPDFRSLTSDAQRLYMMLVSQADISSCGMLPITFRRWSNNAIDTPIDRLSIAFRMLCDRRYLVADMDREEVVIRSFIRWDEGYKVPKRLKAIIASIEALSSPVLKQVTVEELNKLGVPHDIPIDTPIDTGTDTPIDIAQVPGYTYVGNNGNLEPGTENQEPGPRNPSPAAPATVRETDPYLFTEFWEQYPRKVGKDQARKAWANAVRKHHPDEIIKAAGRMARDPNLPEQQYIPHPATWLNRGGWDDEPYPARNPRENGRATPRIATADQRAMDGMSLAARLAAEESQQRLEITS